MCAGILKKVFTSVILFYCVFTIHAQNEDDFCAVTNPLTGEVTLSWNYPNFSGFSSYDIKWGTTLTPTNSVNIPVTGASMSYTVTGINGNTTRYYFHVVGVGTPSLDAVFSNIRLSISPPAYDIAHLNWNPVFFPDSGDYYVQRFESPVWKTVAKIPSVIPNPASYSWHDTISYPFCDTSQVSYRIYFQKAGNPCNSLSNEAVGNFVDRTSPSNPTNDTVSIYIDPGGAYTGCPILGWTRSPERGIAGYIIYREDPVFIVADTIPADSTVFLDKSVRACLKSYRYALAAYDSCGIVSFGTYSAAPHTLLLNVSDISPCDRKAYLSWNTYDHMAGGLGGYIIYRQVNNGPFVAADTVSSTVTTYTDSILFINGNYYTYFVRAFSATGLGTSSSCQGRKLYTGPVVPDTLYISKVTVVNDSYIEASYYYSPQNRVRELVLERADTPAGPFTVVDTLLATGNTFLPQSYTLSDPFADVHSQSYYYRLSMIDSCNKVAMYSDNVSRSIFLSCVSNTATSTNQLSWNDYSAWYMGVEKYELFRTVDGIQNPAGPLSSFPPGGLEYTDNLSDVPPVAAICYYVVASEIPGNPVAVAATSLSNTACAIKDVMFYMPNAFAPEGLNRRFRPVQAFVKPGSFTMQVFNKWGQRIFETSDIDEGWDGYLNGKAAPVDVYIYRVSYQSMNGASYEKRGAFTLVK